MALTSPVVTLVSINAFCILLFCLAANITTKGSIAKIIKVSGMFTFNNIKNDPTNITIDMNKSSGP